VLSKLDVFPNPYLPRSRRMCILYKRTNIPQEKLKTYNVSSRYTETEQERANEMKQDIL